MNTMTQSEELVKDSNQPQTNQERVNSILNNEIIRIETLKELLKEDEKWNIREFEGGDFDFFNYVDKDSITLKKIESWLNLEINVDQLMEQKWEDDWESIVSDQLYQYHPSDFDFIYEDWKRDGDTDELINDEIRSELRY